MKRIRLTRLLFMWHRWLGLVAGLALLAISLSGSALVFQEEIDQALFPRLHLVEERDESLPLDVIYEKARLAYPEAWNLRFRRLQLEEPNRSIQMSLMIRTLRGDEWHYLYVDPYDGKLLGIQGADAKHGFVENPLDWLLWLHFSLFGGKVGMLLVGIVSVAFIGSLLTGLLVYRKKVIPALCFRVPIRFRNLKAGMRSLHHVVGVWALLLNLLLAVTGFWMMRDVFTPGFYASSDPDRTPSPSLTFSLDAVLAEVEQRVPSFVPHDISAIPNDGGFIRIGGMVEDQSPLFSLSSEVVYDEQRSEIVSIDLVSDLSWIEKVEASVGQLHFGSYGGWLTKLVYSVAGLTPPLLSVTGFVLYGSRKALSRRS